MSNKFRKTIIGLANDINIKDYIISKSDINELTKQGVNTSLIEWHPTVSILKIHFIQLKNSMLEANNKSDIFSDEDIDEIDTIYESITIENLDEKLQIFKELENHVFLKIYKIRKPLKKSRKKLSKTSSLFISNKKLFSFIFEAIKSEVEDFGIVSIKKFGSFSVKRRKGGENYVKFIQAKKLKELVSIEIKPLDLNREQLISKQINKILNIDDVILSMDIKGIYQEDIDFLYANFKSPDKKIHLLLENYILDFFVTIQKLVFDFNIIEIEDFGAFYLGHNELYGLHFKYAPKKSADILRRSNLWV